MYKSSPENVVVLIIMHQSYSSACLPPYDDVYFSIFGELQQSCAGRMGLPGGLMAQAPCSPAHDCWSPQTSASTASAEGSC